MNIDWLGTGLLVCVLGLALGYDISSRRIPNAVVVAALAAGCAMNLFAQQTSSAFLGNDPGLGRWFLGTLAGLAVMLPLYLCKGMGAGDVKLMAGVGAFLGPLPVLGAALLTFVAGGVLSLATALWSRTLLRVLGNLRLMGILTLSGRSSGLSMRDVQTTGRLPYALAIAVGTALQLWLATQDGWPFK